MTRDTCIAFFLMGELVAALLYARRDLLARVVGGADMIIF